jgi:recombination protein RecR
MAVKLVRNQGGLLGDMINVLNETKTHIRCCSQCGSITTMDMDPCRLCASPSRDSSLLCVVEESDDIVNIERSGGYRGRYHALMGKISPMKGNGPENLRIRKLMERIKSGEFTEVILALSTDVEGETTAGYIRELLKDNKIKVSRLALGLPSGSAVAYSDPLTIAKAIERRTVG